uniref:Uncharacterized protein n=1 Tax=Rhizophora mucronata TaxID=61149 RepID=A0A2P2PZ23_RHIMU
MGLEAEKFWSQVSILTVG